MIQDAFSISKISGYVKTVTQLFKLHFFKIKKEDISSLDMNRIDFVNDIWLFIIIVVHNCEIYTKSRIFYRLSTYLIFL